ncbi:MAG TPA: type VII secretion protein EccB [Rugosimonospora sp.]|nr:type VII secretion protein EccB [Rugosimonospora sp.]
MQTQKDHLHAYQTLVGRMSSALLRGDTAHGEQPAHRSRLGLVLGLVLGLLAAGGFWVYGLIKPGGNTSWKATGVVVLEKETGNRYVYLGGQLRPVLNQASAYLWLGASSARIVSVSRASLAGVPRGAPFGIPRAPDEVPPAGSLVRGAYLLCLTPVAGTMVLDAPDARRAAPAPDGTYLWVADPSGGQYLIWHDRKLPIQDATVPPALGLPARQPPVAPWTWLGVLLTGPSIGAAPIASYGRPGPRVAGRPHNVGDLLVQANPNGTKQDYVVLADGVSPVGPTDFALLQAKWGGAATPVTAAELVAAPHSSSTMDHLPDLVSSKPSPGRSCIRLSPQGTGLVEEMVVFDEAPVGRGVVLAPASAMYVASVPAPTGTGQKPDRYLITDRGIKYPLRDDESITALGYGGVEPLPMPADVLATLGTGPELSRAAVGVTQP